MSEPKRAGWVFKKSVELDGLFVKEKRTPCLIVGWEGQNDEIAVVKYNDGTFEKLLPGQWE